MYPNLIILNISHLLLNALLSKKHRILNPVNEGSEKNVFNHTRSSTK